MREANSLVETSLETELQVPRLVAELIAAMPVGVALVHPFDLRIMAANPAVANALEPVPEDFLNLASHELRTPLGVINGYASMLSQGGLTEQHQRLAGLRIYEKGR